MSHNEPLHTLCGEWYANLVEKYGETQQSLKAHMIQYAADGIWMEECTGLVSVSPAERQAIVDYLIQQTYEL